MLRRGSSAPLISGEKKTIVDARTDSLDAEMLTVTMGWQIDGSAAPSLVDMFATVTWGVGGATFTAEIDVVNGYVFCIIANYIRIDIGNNSTPGTKFQVSASVGYGTFVHPNSPARRTKELGVILNTASAVVDLPPFASSLVLAGINPAAGGSPPPGPVQIDFLSAVTPASYNMKEWSNLGYLNPDTFPIPNGANQALITNKSGVDLNLGVIFGISI